MKQNLEDAWAKLEEMENIFQTMMVKTYRLQSQRVCLEMLSGEPGDGHPHSVSTKLGFSNFSNIFKITKRHPYKQSRTQVPVLERKGGFIK